MSTSANANSNKLYVGSLPYTTTDQELKTLFEPHGHVVSARMVMDKMTGKSKGFGFVEFDSAETAEKAFQAMNKSEFGGRKMVVSIAHPPKPRDQRNP